jgi:hypothetical protein
VLDKQILISYERKEFSPVKDVKAVGVIRKEVRDGEAGQESEFYSFDNQVAVDFGYLHGLELASTKDIRPGVASIFDPPGKY